VALPYPPLQVEVRTPKLALLAATDERLEQLLPLVRAGVADREPWPFDDPMSLYDDNPSRERRWLRAIWAARARIDSAFWRLCFVVESDGEFVGMQDLIGLDFATYGTVTTFSWLAPDARGRGLGTEMRQAILHLAFDGFEAKEASSEAFTDNHASNAVSRSLGYAENGMTWATRKEQAAELYRWRLTREAWLSRQRDDIELVGVPDCREVFGI
jgi:RimJ/RimL family protein N-acetyltransferase